MTFRALLTAALCCVAGGPAAVHAEIRVDLFGTSAPPAATSDGRFSWIPFADDPRPVEPIGSQFVDGIPAAQTPYGGDVDFATPMNLTHLQVGDGWMTWSNTYTGDVYFSGLDLGMVVIDLPPDAGAFYLYVQPNQGSTFEMRVEGRNAAGDAISRSLPISGTGGAQGFGFWESSGGSLDQVSVVDLSGGDSLGFGIGQFGGAARLVAFEPPENNDDCVGAHAGRTITISEDCSMVVGKLEERVVPGPAPDTFLCVVDKRDNVIDQNNDKGSLETFGKGNPWASAIWSTDDDKDGVADALVRNGDGTYSLRLIVTGFPDGLDGTCNGFFQNAPHGQLGEWEVCVFLGPMSQDDAEPAPPPALTYRDEFRSGAEAFRVNFTVPPVPEIHIEIDNTIGREPVCLDRDFFCLAGFAPLEPVYLTVVGGLDEACRPTDTQLCWFDKDCNVIGGDDGGGPAPGYSEMFAVADANGVICLGVSGGGDKNCNGFIDPDEIDEEGRRIAGAPHGVCGDYLLKVRRVEGRDRDGDQPRPRSEALEQALLGDLNGDGGVDGLDLGILLTNWGQVF